MHIPVLQKEVLEYLDPKPNENFIDCTISEAGHSRSILEKEAHLASLGTGYRRYSMIMSGLSIFWERTKNEYKFSQ